MIPAVIIASLLGIASLVQVSLNQRIAQQFGLALTSMINGIVIFGAGLSAFFIVTSLSQFQNPFSLKRETLLVSEILLLLVPGLLGFALSTGLPASVARFGALRVVTVFTVTQLLASFVFDIVFAKQPLSITRLTGAMLAATGSFLVSLK